VGPPWWEEGGGGACIEAILNGGKGMENHEGGERDDEDEIKKAVAKDHHPIGMQVLHDDDDIAHPANDLLLNQWY